MKAKSVLIFLLLTFLGLAFLGMVFPAEGITIAGKNLRFVTPYNVIALDTLTKAKLKLEEQTEYLHKLHLTNKKDSLQVLKSFSKTSASRIYYPLNNPTYFHSLFTELDSSKSNDAIVRIIHYGDSQLEMDRITDVFRAKLQSEFGGLGTGILPAIQAIPKKTVSQYASGNLVRHAINDSTRIGVSHRRFGVMGMFSSLDSFATIHFRTSKTAFETTKSFSTVKLLVRNNARVFSAQLKVGSTLLETKKIDSSGIDVHLLKWEFPTPETRGSITLRGNADIYGFSLEGNSGVVVDNIALRGSSGEFFSGLDSHSLSKGLKKMDTRLILLQFGGNAMPVIQNQKKVEYYTGIMAKQIQFLKTICPEAKLMFIGPSDMGTKINGVLQTRPFLRELNEALKNTALQNGIAYWDLFNTMGGQNSMLEWVKAKPALAHSDYTHFSQKGADKVGEMLFTSFFNDYLIYTLQHQIQNMDSLDE